MVAEHSASPVAEGELKRKVRSRAEGQLVAEHEGGGCAALDVERRATAADDVVPVVGRVHPSLDLRRDRGERAGVSGAEIRRRRQKLVGSAEGGETLGGEGAELETGRDVLRREQTVEAGHGRVPQPLQPEQRAGARRQKRGVALAQRSAAVRLEAS